MAAAPSLSDVLGTSGIVAAGYVDGSYEAFFNKSGGATNQVLLHEFDTDANSFVLNQAALTLSYLPTDGFGALVNVITGNDAKAINGTYGDGGGVFSLTQAYVQWAHGPITVIGGRFVTLAGNEVIDDTKNTNVSRSLLFTNLEPLVHTGVRGSYKFSDVVTGYLGVNNSAYESALSTPSTTIPASPATIPLSSAGNDNDKHKTAELGAAITPTSALSISVVDYYGLDGDGAAAIKNNYLDSVISFQATKDLQVVVNGDYIKAVAHTGSRTAYGAATYVNYSFTDSLKGSVRGEYIRATAHDTAAGSDSGDVMEGTITLDYTAATNFDLLGEVRDDYATSVAPGVGLFPADGGDTRKSQPEVLLKAIFKFGTPVAAAS